MDNEQYRRMRQAREARLEQIAEQAGDRNATHRRKYRLASKATTRRKGIKRQNNNKRGTRP